MTQSDIQIRRVRPQDAAAITQLMGDPEVFGNLLQLPYPSEASCNQRLAQAPAEQSLQLVAERQGQLIASAGLHGIGLHVRRRHAMGLGMCVAAEAQGQGVGSALMQALIDYADQWGHVLRIELTVLPITRGRLRFMSALVLSTRGGTEPMLCATGLTAMFWPWPGCIRTLLGGLNVTGAADSLGSPLRSPFH